MAETEAEGKAGFSQGARCGTRSQDSRIIPWAEGRCPTAEPPRHPSECPFEMKLLWCSARVPWGQIPLNTVAVYFKLRSSDIMYEWYKAYGWKVDITKASTLSKDLVYIAV